MKFYITINRVWNNIFIIIFITFCLVGFELAHITVFKETVLMVSRV